MGDTAIHWDAAQFGPRSRETTRARITAAARGVFLARGYAAATIDEIAQAAGTRRSTIYNHFREKEEILEAISDGYLAGVLEVIARLPGPRPSRRQIDQWIADFAEFTLLERAPTLLFVGFNSGFDAPRTAEAFGHSMMQALGERIPAFADALQPGNELAFARAATVVRELAVALAFNLRHEGRSDARCRLEVAADLFEQLCKGWF